MRFWTKNSVKLTSLFITYGIEHCGPTERFVHVGADCAGQERADGAASGRGAKEKAPVLGVQISRRNASYGRKMYALGGADHNSSEHDQGELGGQENNLPEPKCQQTPDDASC